MIFIVCVITQIALYVAFTRSERKLNSDLMDSVLVMNRDLHARIQSLEHKIK